MGFLGGLIGAGASLLGSVFSAKKQKETNAANIQQAQDQMAFQERMSSTAHQREVEDLRKAGLNPILSANHGASTPGGAMATLENPYSSLASDANNSAKTFMEMKLNRAMISKVEADSKASSAQARLADAQAAKVSFGTIPGTDIPLSSAKRLFSAAKRHATDLITLPYRTGYGIGLKIAQAESKR